MTKETHIDKKRLLEFIEDAKKLKFTYEEWNRSHPKEAYVSNESLDEMTLRLIEKEKWQLLHYYGHLDIARMKKLKNYLFLCFLGNDIF